MPRLAARGKQLGKRLPEQNEKPITAPSLLSCLLSAQGQSSFVTSQEQPSPAPGGNKPKERLFSDTHELRVAVQRRELF